MLEISSGDEVPTAKQKKGTCPRLFAGSQLTVIESGPKRRKGVNTVDEDGVLEDIIVTSTSGPSSTRREEKTRDISVFFNDAQLVTLSNGSMKLYHFGKNCL